MQNSLKVELIELILSLRQVPPQIQKDLDAIVKTLKRGDIVIPESDRGKRETCELIIMLFCAYPRLMTDANKPQLKAFSERVGLAPQSKQGPGARQKPGKR